MGENNEQIARNSFRENKIINDKEVSSICCTGLGESVSTHYLMRAGEGRLAQELDQAGDLTLNVTK